MTSASGAPAGSRFYRPELDAIRFFAFGLVFLSHSIPLKNDSPHWLIAIRAACAFGVPVFFSLSAYLITELLIRERETRGFVDLKAFYSRRILRIWPLYFLALGICFVVARHVRGVGMPVRQLLAYLLLVGNWSSIAAGGGLPNNFSHLWSIAVEEQFYLAWPSIARLGTRKMILIFSCIGWLISQIGTMLLCLRHIPISPNLWLNTVTHIQYFAIGAGLSAALGGGVPIMSTGKRLVLAALGLVAFFTANFVFNAFIYGDPFSTVSRTFPGYTMAGVGVVLLLLAAMGSQIGNSGTLRYLGKISYGLYIYHLPVILLCTLLGQRLLRRHVSFVTFGLGIPLTLLLAGLSYQYFEKPFLRLKERFEVVKSRVA